MLFVEALLPAEVYRQLKAGMVAQVVPTIQDEATYEAKVAIIDRVLDPASGTFGIRLEMKNPQGAVLAGTRCRVKFDSINLAAPARGGDEPRSQRPAAAPRPITQPPPR